MSNLCEVGVDPRCWYPAVRERDLRPGDRREVEFLGRSYVLYRDRNNAVHALDNACAHRRVALHEGEVRDCRIVCPYHGWEFDPDGTLARVPYWPPTAELPSLRVPSYPTAIGSGLIWFIPEPSGELPPLPADTSPWENEDWFSFRLDNEFANHYGIGLINGMDYFHFHLHRKYQPWSDLQLLDLAVNEDRITGQYRVTTGRSRPERVLRSLMGSSAQAETVTSALTVHYFYPHHLAELGDDIKVWVFFRPARRDLVHVYVTMYIRARGWQRQTRRVFEPTFRRLVLNRIQRQDAWIGEIEQVAWEERPDEPRCELNPVASAAERLMRAKWRHYLAQRPEPVPDAWRWTPARRHSTDGTAELPLADGTAELPLPDGTAEPLPDGTAELSLAEGRTAAPDGVAARS